MRTSQQIHFYEWLVGDVERTLKQGLHYANYLEVLSDKLAIVFFARVNALNISQLFNKKASFEYLLDTKLTIYYLQQFSVFYRCV